MVERVNIAEREQRVEMQANNKKNNLEDKVLWLECLESWNYEVNWMKMQDSMTNLSDCNNKIKGSRNCSEWQKKKKKQSWSSTDIAGGLIAHFFYAMPYIVWGGK